MELRDFEYEVTVNMKVIVSAVPKVLNPPDVEDELHDYLRDHLESELKHVEFDVNAELEYDLVPEEDREEGDEGADLELNFISFVYEIEDISIGSATATDVTT